MLQMSAHFSSTLRLRVHGSDYMYIEASPREVISHQLLDSANIASTKFLSFKRVANKVSSVL